MASVHKSICFLTTFFITFMSTTHAYTFQVGGKDGWTLHPSENYNSWSGRLRFLINDTLHFKYDAKSNSVLAVNKGDYDACNAKKPITKMDGGDSMFKLDRSGPFYFITSNKSNCDQGQKLSVVVLSLRKRSPPSTVATPPSHSVSPPYSAVSPVSPPSIYPDSPPSTSPVSPPSTIGSPVSPPAEAPIMSPPASSPDGGSADSPDEASADSPDEASADSPEEMSGDSPVEESGDAPAPAPGGAKPPEAKTPAANANKSPQSVTIMPTVYGIIIVSVVTMMFGLE